MFPIIYKINTIWIRSQFAKGLASPRWVGIEQSGLGHFSFLRIDARQPLRYDLFCSSLLSRVSWTRWSPKGLAKALGCPTVSSGTGLNPQGGKARGLQDGFRVTVPGFWLVSQGILFTAASTEHEAEFLEV